MTPMTMPSSADIGSGGAVKYQHDMLRSLRDLFTVVGDRRSSADAMYETVEIYGAGIPAMRCSCGEALEWRDWPDHWRDKHGI